MNLMDPTNPMIGIRMFKIIVHIKITSVIAFDTNITLYANVTDYPR
jgi:hypothetical protein